MRTKFSTQWKGELLLFIFIYFRTNHDFWDFFRCYSEYFSLLFVFFVFKCSDCWFFFVYLRSFLFFFYSMSFILKFSMLRISYFRIHVHSIFFTILALSSTFYLIFIFFCIYLFDNSFIYLLTYLFIYLFIYLSTY